MSVDRGRRRSSPAMSGSLERPAPPAPLRLLRALRRVDAWLDGRPLENATLGLLPRRAPRLRPRRKWSSLPAIVPATRPRFEAVGFAGGRAGCRTTPRSTPVAGGERGPRVAAWRMAREPEQGIPPRWLRTRVVFCLREANAHGAQRLLAEPDAVPLMRRGGSADGLEAGAATRGLRGAAPPGTRKTDLPIMTKPSIYVALPAVLRPGPSAGPLAGVLRPVFGEGCSLALAGMTGLIELLLDVRSRSRRVKAPVSPILWS